jgi:membrane-associated phospholipid phosphatase
MTIHDWFFVHHWPALDLFFAVPYATFLAACVLTTIYLYFKNRSAMRTFAMGFLVLNVLGFATYHLMPAAPPWYFHTRGCTVDLATQATEGPALARVDAMLGVSFFRGMYARSSSVFGALPSLHCAYPVLIVMVGWKHFGTMLRALSIGFACWMILAAMYLDHHWLLDAILGVSYAVTTVLGLGALDRYRLRKTQALPSIAETESQLSPLSGGGT